MTDDAGNMSIDFLIGFTIFILSFIWVATLIPGIMIGLQSNTIDFDAVAYRTGVILVEDPGWPASPGWESYDDLQKPNITRFGLAISKDSPNILSEDKVNRFFCTSFIYPEEYQQRAIFGDRPYHFNISLMDIERNETRSVGEVRPDGYGYIRRLVKIKGTSNASIDSLYILTHKFNNTAQPSDFNVTTHEFSILFNSTKLLGDIKDPAYQINPSREQTMINITDLRSTIFPAPPTAASSVRINLTSIKVYKLDAGTFAMVRFFDKPYIDGNSVTSLPPVPVQENVTLKFDPQFFDIMRADFSKIYINLTFDMVDIAGNPVKSSFLNNTRSSPFDYNYNPANVTQPRLRDAVVEVAVW
ncbi:MAG: hypothetical protein Q8R70_05770 [Methanoregula sp.]|nr:hypothetical protein [Methanoregula sp.]